MACDGDERVRGRRDRVVKRRAACNTDDDGRQAPHVHVDEHEVDGDVLMDEWDADDGDV